MAGEMREFKVIIAGKEEVISTRTQVQAIKYAHSRAYRTENYVTNTSMQTRHVTEAYEVWEGDRLITKEGYIRSQDKHQKKEAFLKRFLLPRRISKKNTAK